MASSNATGARPSADHPILPAFYDELRDRELASVPMSRSEVELAIARYDELTETVNRLGGMPDLNGAARAEYYAASDERLELYDRLNLAVALKYLPAGVRPREMDGVVAHFEAEVAMSSADVAAHRLASYVRSTPARVAPGDSDPDADEALRRARSPRQAVSA